MKSSIALQVEFARYGLAGIQKKGNLKQMEAALTKLSNSDYNRLPAFYFTVGETHISHPADVNFQD